MLYDVTFDTTTLKVEAANEADAWSAFCAIYGPAARHPNRFPRTILPAAIVITRPADVPAPELPPEPPGTGGD